jgi:hypothetical protein
MIELPPGVPERLRAGAVPSADPSAPNSWSSDMSTFELAELYRDVLGDRRQREAEAARREAGEPPRRSTFL